MRDNIWGRGLSAKFRRVANAESLQWGGVFVSLAFIIFAAGCRIYLDSKLFEGYPYDGPFQHLYPLRRMDLGQLPGRDFFFFHGNGIPFVHYPIYWLGGGNLFSALLSAKIVQFCSVFFGIWYFFAGVFSVKKSYLVTLGVIVVYLSGVLPVFSTTPFWDPSSFGVRTLTSLIVGGLVARQSRKGGAWTYSQVACVAMLSTIGVLLGTEQGVYCFFGALIVISLQTWKYGARGVFVKAAALSGFFLVTLIAIHFLMFGSIDGIRFIKNVVDDQVWYYGVPPVPFVKNVWRWLFLQSQEGKAVAIMLYVSVFFFAAFWLSWKKRLVGDAAYWSITFLFFSSMFGLTSVFGMAAFHYVEPLARYCLFVMFAWGAGGGAVLIKSAAVQRIACKLVG